ncbi:hypothetical protein R3P38DRAFT_3604688 [Favolaschia claudopus]|uniref:Uncharacterized protein n=1 Tax=Favolaschia claudopus TaxID=2862362 RepID=A0AAW0A9P5_9AGAR
MIRRSAESGYFSSWGFGPLIGMGVPEWNHRIMRYFSYGGYSELAVYMRNHVEQSRIDFECARLVSPKARQLLYADLPTDWPGHSICLVTAWPLPEDQGLPAFGLVKAAFMDDGIEDVDMMMAGLELNAREDEMEVDPALKPFWGAATWPLIAKVNIRGPFPVLSSGIVLADLPGHGDADIVRNKVADQYMQDANTIFLVAPINRAIDDEGVQNHLKKHISQSIIDGRIAEDSVVLVLTQHDVIGSNVDTASSKDSDAEIEELTNQLKTHKSQKKQPKDSKHSRLPETRKLRASLGIAMCQRQKELAQGRCLAVISALQHKYQSIYANVSGASAPPRPIPIFCVGSSDYLILHDHSPTKTAIFSSKSETGIPALYTHTMHIGERQGVADAIHLLFLTYQLLNQSSITVEGDDEGSEIRLEKECEQEVASLVQSIEKMFAMIVDESSPLIDAAKQQSLHVFQAVAETHKWNQYSV